MGQNNSEILRQIPPIELLSLFQLASLDYPPIVYVV